MLRDARSQSFAYDNVNRIYQGATGATTGSLCWGKQFNIDAWGNLYSTTALTGFGSCPQTALSLSINGNNQVSTDQYDLSGDMTYDGTYNYTYDGEGEQVSAAGVTYSYDGDGRRVQKSTNELYWYGPGGEVLEETDASGNVLADYVYFGGQRLARVVSGRAPYYYFHDHLNSSRVIVQGGQYAACYDADFEPYGAEHVVTDTCLQNYKFTGKERDPETQNDYFGARFYQSNLGRFMSPDPGRMNLSTFADPQRINRYTYVRNNPLRNVDSDGREMKTATSGAALDQLVSRLAAVERRPSGQAALQQLKGSLITFEFNLKSLVTDKQLHTAGLVPIEPGHIHVNLVPADASSNGQVNRSETTVNIDLDLRITGEDITRHEVEHGIQADNDPLGVYRAQEAGENSPHYNALQEDADQFAHAPQEPNDKPTMSQEDAEKVVKDMLTKPNPPSPAPPPPKAQ